MAAFAIASLVIKEVKMCLRSEWLSITMGECLGILVSIAGIIVAYFIGKRYSSGNVQIVDKALCHERLERAAEILSEALKCQEHGADEIKKALLHLYNCEGAKYRILSDVFRDLEHVCALIHDNAIPPSMEKSARNEIRSFLSRSHINCFVNAYKETYPMLSVLAEETREKRN